MQLLVNASVQAMACDPAAECHKSAAPLSPHPGPHMIRQCPQHVQLTGQLLLERQADAVDESLGEAAVGCVGGWRCQKLRVRQVQP